MHRAELGLGVPGGASFRQGGLVGEDPVNGGVAKRRQAMKENRS